MLSSLLSIPFRLGAWLDSPPAGMCACTSCTDDVPIVVSLAANSASTSAASDGRSRFLTARFWFAQLAASSPEPSSLTSARSCSRSLAEACSPSIGLAVGSLGFGSRRGVVPLERGDEQSQIRRHSRSLARHRCRLWKPADQAHRDHLRRQSRPTQKARIFARR